MRTPAEPRRAVITLLAIAPALSVIATGLAGLDRPSYETPCWILPNGLAVRVPGTGACPIASDALVTAVVSGAGRAPIRPRERIDWAAARHAGVARVEVMLYGERELVDVPVRRVTASEQLARAGAACVLSVTLLSIPLAILWTSAAPAATPIALGYGLVAAIGAGLATGREAPGVTSAILLAACTAPFILLHLALVFPRERQVVRSEPGLVRIVYVPLLGFAPLALLALHAEPAVWPAFASLLLVLSGSAWLGVVIACVFAVRESRSQLERARARALGLGAVLLPLMPTALAVEAGAGPARWIGVYVACAAVMLPVPIALGITSYNLFDLGWDARRRVGCVLYVVLAAAVLAVGLHVPFDPSPESWGTTPGVLRSFALAVTGIALMESLRARLLEAVDSLVLPHALELRRSREAFEREVAALRGQDEVAAALGSAIGAALGSGGGCVALRIDAGWRIAASFGAGPGRAAVLTREAARVIGAKSLVHLAGADLEAQDDVRRLLDADLEIVAAVAAGGRMHALLLVGPRASLKPYTGFEVEFVRSLCGRAAAALENARLADELVAAERRATTGRIAVALAHDVGKELGWIVRLAQRLPNRRFEPGRLARDADQIAELAEGALCELQGFAESAAHARHDANLASVAEILELASRQATRQHADARIAICVDPTLRGVLTHTALARVLGNALENAILAAQDDPVVELSAQQTAGQVRFEVRDAGCGMPPDVAARACDPGFTSRRDQGGLGIGLTAAREIAVALGGRLRIRTRPGVGTTVCVDVPAHEARS